MFDKEYWRKREEEVMERQNKEMKNVYKQLKNGEVTLTSKAKAMAGVWDIPKGTLDEDIVDDRILKMISSHGLMSENKILKEKLSDAKWWLKEILNNSENASDFQKYMREEFGEVIK